MKSWQERDAAAELADVIEDLYSAANLLTSSRPELAKRAAELAGDVRALLEALKSS
jgi:hypothetical protein